MGPGRVLVLLALAVAADSARADARSVLRQTPRLVLPSLARTPPPAPSKPAASLRLPVATELAIEREIDHAIEHGDMPGAVVVVGRRSGVSFRRAFGLAAVLPAPRPMTADAVFDLASVTKAVATATSIAALVEDGQLAYDEPIARSLPIFATEDKRGITLRHLLTHTSGLPAVNPVPTHPVGAREMLADIAGTKLVSAPGEQYRYSDLGFIALGEVVRHRAKESLDHFVARRLFAPLGLRNTRFVPGGGPRLVPTEKEGEAFLLGTVHDPRARALGGVAGHAGLFSTADELARFARMLLAGGELDDKRVLRAGTVARMTAPIEVPGARVALGWDSPDDPTRSVFSARSFGHEGFTGTSLWIDPQADRFVVFLSSRLHPDGKGRVAPTAQAIRALVAHVREEPRQPVVELGIERLLRNGAKLLGGARVAYLTHSAARDGEGRRSVDRLFEVLGARLVRIVTPEHGMSGTLEGPVPNGRDPRTDLPIVSLYGAASSAPAWQGVDTIVVDLVDVGVRFYTYLSALRTALESGRRVVVLDRPNPNGGLDVEGPVSLAAPPSLIDPHPLPVMHGMTFGELARMLLAERGLGTRLEVLPMTGWRRGMSFGDTGLSWFAPSPNLRSASAARLYPGLALLELTNVSVGRGTSTPFEVVAAPWLDAPELIRVVGPVAGVRFRAGDVTPSAGPYRGERCAAVFFALTDPAALRPVDLGLGLARALRLTHPETWETRNLGVLLGGSAARDALLSDEPLASVERTFAAQAAAFVERRRPYLLYE